MLLDYYFMHVLALLAVRVWDEGDADANLDRGRATARSCCRGRHGSGQLFAADAETLLLIATSHYEMYERGYAVLLEQVRTLNARHQLKVALGHAVSMGCHLRFGFEATYGRDTINMRDDNVADYPWLLYALRTLMREYVSGCTPTGQTRRRATPVVEALVNGLSGDARALVGRPPASLPRSKASALAFRRRVSRAQAGAAARVRTLRPGELSLLAAELLLQLLAQRRQRHGHRCTPRASGPGR